MENIKEYDLIHNGLYMIDKKVARYDAGKHYFFRLDGKRLGFITRMQRSYALACCIGTKGLTGMGMDFKNYHIYPIALTAEILEKNGFKTNNDHTLTGSCIYRRLCGKWDEYEVAVRLLNGWITIRSFDERWHDLLNVHYQPRYIHELQHALRLCGLHELADNFKI